MRSYFKMMVLAACVAAFPMLPQAADAHFTGASHEHLSPATDFAILGAPEVHMICNRCGHSEDVGLTLAFNIGKTYYTKSGFSLSDLSLDKNKLSDTLSKAAKISSQKLYSFFFADNKKDVEGKDANAIMRWINKNYKCDKCGSGNWSCDMGKSAKG